MYKLYAAQNQGHQITDIIDLESAILMHCEEVSGTLVVVLEHGNMLHTMHLRN